MAKYEFEKNGVLKLANDIRLDTQRPWLDRLPSDIHSILDVGAGVGSHSQYFKDRGFVPTALDVDGSDFMFHGEIEFLESNICELDESRKFDAIFLSHVVEHFPNLERSISYLRGCLTDRGYIFVVVPPYEPIACDNHWQTGWNCAQLAMTLVTCGFDCADATFAELGGNVCGWGRRRDSELLNEWTDQNFEIKRCEPFLPAAMRATIFQSKAGNYHLPDLVFCDAERAVRRAQRHVMAQANFRFADAKLLRFDDKAEFHDISIELQQPVDLNRRILQVMSLCSGSLVDLRVAVSSDPAEAENRYANAAEAYIGNGLGLTSCELLPYVFSPISGEVDFSVIRRISIGGRGTQGITNLWAYIDNAPLFSTADDLERSEVPGTYLPANSAAFPAAFDPATYAILLYGDKTEFLDVCLHCPQSLNLRSAPLQLVVRCEGEVVPLRVALDSSHAGDWSETTEKYLELGPGITVSTITPQALHGMGEATDLSAVRHLSIGGQGQCSRVWIWAIYGDTNLIPDGATISNHTRSSSRDNAMHKYEAETASNLFTLRNKVTLLEWDLAKLQREVTDGQSGQEAGERDPQSEDTSLAQTQELLREAQGRLEFVEGYPYRIAVAYRELPAWVRIIVRSVLLPFIRTAAAMRRALRGERQ